MVDPNERKGISSTLFAILSTSLIQSLIDDYIRNSEWYYPILIGLIVITWIISRLLINIEGVLHILLAVSVITIIIVNIFLISKTIWLFVSFGNIGDAGGLLLIMALGTTGLEIATFGLLWGDFSDIGNQFIALICQTPILVFYFLISGTAAEIFL